jgi:transcriptional regulator of acetoin/glycerol metabolism
MAVASESEAESAALRRLLEETQWNCSEAARQLKIGYRTLLNKVHQFGLERVPL